MARRIMTGLDYLPLDISFFQDRKVRKLQRRADPNAPIVYLAILCAIYKEGYCLRWDEDMAFDIAELLHVEESYVRRVVEVCLEVELFHKPTFDAHEVLTSAGIQRRYEHVCEKSKRKARIAQFSLINLEEMPINSEEMPENENNEPDTSEFMQTSKASKVSKEEKEIYKEKEKLKAECFFRNWRNPFRELEKIETYYTGPKAKKKWKSMTVDEKVSAIRMWSQVPQQPARFTPSLLSAWKGVYEPLVNMSAPENVRAAALDNGLDILPGSSVLTLVLPTCLAAYLENNTQIFAGAMRELQMRAMCKKIIYRIYDGQIEQIQTPKQ